MNSSPMKDVFNGHWLVSEYVYNADGTFAGIVRQRRMLQALDGGLLRVLQQCQPDERLAGHPMAAFQGEWAFDLAVDGRARRYLGPDVLGSGLAWGDGVVTGRGVWPRFGHNFTAFSLLLTPTLQITGGKFFNAGQLIANIIGVAVPEMSVQQRPEFAGTTYPQHIAALWRGSSETFAPDGRLLGGYHSTRRYHDGGWTDETAQTTMRPLGEHWLVEQDNRRGIGKRSGWLLEIELHNAQEHSQTLEILDAARGYLIVLENRWRDNVQFMDLNIRILRPEK